MRHRSISSVRHSRRSLTETFSIRRDVNPGTSNRGKTRPLDSPLRAPALRQSVVDPNAIHAEPAERRTRSRATHPNPRPRRCHKPANDLQPETFAKLQSFRATAAPTAAAFHRCGWSDNSIVRLAQRKDLAHAI